MRSLYSPVGCSAKGDSGRCSFCFFGFLLVSVELMSRTGTVFITRAVGVVSSSGENTACCACAHTAPDIQIAEQGVGNRTKEYRPINSAVGPTKLLAGRWFPPPIKVLRRAKCAARRQLSAKVVCGVWKSVLQNVMSITRFSSMKTMNIKQYGVFGPLLLNKKKTMICSCGRLMLIADSQCLSLSRSARRDSERQAAGPLKVPNLS